MANTAKNLFKKTVKATGDLVGNKIADKTVKFWRTSPQNDSESLTNKEESIGLDREMARERCKSSENKQKIIDDLRLI